MVETSFGHKHAEPHEETKGRRHERTLTFLLCPLFAPCSGLLLPLTLSFRSPLLLHPFARCPLLLVITVVKVLFWRLNVMLPRGIGTFQPVNARKRTIYRAYPCTVYISTVNISMRACLNLCNYVIAYMSIVMSKVHQAYL